MKQTLKTIFDILFGICYFVGCVTIALAACSLVVTALAAVGTLFVAGFLFVMEAYSFSQAHPTQFIIAVFACMLFWRLGNLVDAIKGKNS